MQINRRATLMLLILAILLLAGLACNLPVSQIGEPNTEPIPTILVPPANESLTITLTEAQLNSLVDQALQSQQQQVIRNAQVYIRNGYIQLQGDIQQNNLTLPLTLKITVAANGQGGVQYRILSASIGPFPLPQDMVDQIAAQLSTALDEQIQAATNNIYIENIIINDGSITISGHAR